MRINHAAGCVLNTEYPKENLDVIKPVFADVIFRICHNNLYWLSAVLSPELHVEYKPKNSETMAKNHGKQIKNDAKYEALRRGGASKEKAARIANSPGASRRGGENDKLEERTRKELLAQATSIGIKGRHQLRKNELIDAIRRH